MRWKQTQVYNNDTLKRKIIEFNLRCAEEYSHSNKVYSVFSSTHTTDFSQQRHR